MRLQEFYSHKKASFQGFSYFSGKFSVFIILKPFLSPHIKQADSSLCLSSIFMDESRPKTVKAVAYASAVMQLSAITVELNMSEFSE